MGKVAIVIDTTITLPAALIQQYHIKVVPQVLIWGEQVLEDQVDIQPGEFYNRLEVDKIHPSTSQVSVMSFQKAYKELTESGFDVLTIVLSKKLSGTYQSAIQARELFPGRKIEIVDSGYTSVATGFQALAAARALEGGASLQESIDLVERSKDHVGVLFVVDTLKYLHLGGRIGGATRFLGTALDLKPVLELQDGAIEPAGRVRTKAKAYQKLLDLLDKRIGGRKPVHLAALHAKAAVDAQSVLDKAVAAHHPTENFLCELSPVLGTHTGPGTIGIGFMAGI